MDAAHPEAYTVGEWGVDLGLPKRCIYARGRMALCAVGCQFTVPLGPAPDPPSVGPGFSWTHAKTDNEKFVIILFLHIILYIF